MDFQLSVETRIENALNRLQSMSMYWDEEWTKPEGDRIWLSGDFTSMKTGWVEGAIEAGMSVAKAIC